MAVEGGVSRRQAAARYEVAISTVIEWVNRFQETGSIEPGKIGGYKPKILSGEHRLWLIERCKEKDFTLKSGAGNTRAFLPGRFPIRRRCWQ